MGGYIQGFPLADIINYCSLILWPILWLREKETVHAIRVWLDVDDSYADVLDIKGVPN